MADDYWECHNILSSYLHFFADHHFLILGKQEESLAAEGTSLKSLLDRKEKGMLHPVEGIWEDADGEILVSSAVRGPAGGPHMVAVRLDGRRRASGPPLALFWLENGRTWAEYRTPDGVGRLTAELLREGALLRVGPQMGWRRVFPATDSQGLPAGDPLAPSLRELRPGVRYLSLPSFHPQYREPLREILKAERDALAQTEGLIVDLRGNSGGDALYFEMEEFIFDGPFVSAEASSVLSSDWNIAYFESLRSRTNDEASRKFFDDLLEEMSLNKGDAVELHGRRLQQPKELSPGPRQVVILQDRSVGSAAEAFLFHASQSSRVVAMGEPSKGNIDYKQVQIRDMGCRDLTYQLAYPLFFESRLPHGAVDATGYRPEVRLAPGVDWIDFATRWIEHRAEAR